MTPTPSTADESEKRSVDPKSLPVEGLATVAQPESWMLTGRGGPPIERVYFPPDAGTADGISTTYLLDHAARRYWVVQSGGYAGRIRVLGPGSMDP